MTMPVAAAQAMLVMLPMGAVIAVTPRQAFAGSVPPFDEMFSLTVVFAALATESPSVTRARIVVVLYAGSAIAARCR